MEFFKIYMEAFKRNIKKQWIQLLSFLKSIPDLCSLNKFKLYINEAITALFNHVKICWRNFLNNKIKLPVHKAKAYVVQSIVTFYLNSLAHCRQFFTVKIKRPFDECKAATIAFLQPLYLKLVKNYHYFFSFIQPWYSKRNLWIGIVLASITINVLSLAFPIFLLQIYDRILVNQSVVTLFLLAAGVMGALIVECFLTAIRGLILSWCAMRYEYKNDMAAFEAFITMPINKVTGYNAGEFLEEFNSIRLLKSFYGGRGLITLCELPFASVFIFFISYLSYSLGIILILLIALQIYVTFPISKRLAAFDFNKKTIINKRNSFLVNLLAGISTIKAFSMEALMMRRYERLQDKMSSENLHVSLNQTQLNLLSSHISQIAMVFIAIVGSVGVLHHHLTLGALTACMILTGRVSSIVNQAIEQASRFEQVKAANLHCQRLLLQHDRNAVEQQGRINTISGKIEVKNVSFLDKKNNQLILSDINLIASPGEMICLQGSDEAGRGLLLQLMRGLIQPTQGEVLLDGHEFYQFNEVLLDEKLLYLPANPVLFNGTLLENLTLFDMEKASQAKEICNKLCLEAFIDRLPQGYETWVSMDNNAFLPAGIKQLINLVRAITKDPQVLLLDEAILFLDYNSERAFRSLLNELRTKKTIVIINYRPSICSLAARHYSLRDGKLMEVQHQAYANHQ